MDKIATSISDKLWTDAETLLDMAGIYPGDITGALSREAFVLQYIVELIDDVDWAQVEEDYEEDRPVVTVTCG